MVTCDCVEIEDELGLMEDEVEEAKGKVSDYQCDRNNQLWYSEIILSEMEDIIDILGLGADPTTDYEELMNIAKYLNLLSKGVLATLGWCMALVLLLTIEGLACSYGTSKDLERYYLMKLNEWQKKLEEREARYNKIEDKLDECKSNLIECEGCGEKFVDKKGCGRVCKGCRRWYCASCFDEAIESAELAAGVAF